MIEQHEHVPAGFVGRAFLFAKCAVCSQVITVITPTGKIGKAWRPVVNGRILTKR